MPAVRKVRHVAGAALLSASHFMLAGAEDVNGSRTRAASTGLTGVRPLCPRGPEGVVSRARIFVFSEHPQAGGAVTRVSASISHAYCSPREPRPTEIGMQ